MVGKGRMNVARADSYLLGWSISAAHKPLTYLLSLRTARLWTLRIVSLTYTRHKPLEAGQGRFAEDPLAGPDDVHAALALSLDRSAHRKGEGYEIHPNVPRGNTYVSFTARAGLRLLWVDPLPFHPGTFHYGGEFKAFA